MVGLLAAAFLQKTPGAKIIHDPRLTWNTRDMVEPDGGVAIQSKTGLTYKETRPQAAATPAVATRYQHSAAPIPSKTGLQVASAR